MFRRNKFLQCAPNCVLVWEYFFLKSNSRDVVKFTSSLKILGAILNRVCYGFLLPEGVAFETIEIPKRIVRGLDIESLSILL